jgi:hypothetical protein
MLSNMKVPSLAKLRTLFLLVVLVALITIKPALAQVDTSASSTEGISSASLLLRLKQQQRNPRVRRQRMTLQKR